MEYQKRDIIIMITIIMQIMISFSKLFLAETAGHNEASS